MTYDEILDEVAKENGHLGSYSLLLTGMIDIVEPVIREAAERYADQFKQDFTKDCQCKEGESTGEMWCCNNCGLPVKDANKRQVELPSDEQIRIWSQSPIGAVNENFVSAANFIRNHIKNQLNDKK